MLEEPACRAGVTDVRHYGIHGVRDPLASELLAREDVQLVAVAAARALHRRKEPQPTVAFEQSAVPRREVVDQHAVELPRVGKVRCTVQLDPAIGARLRDHPPLRIHPEHERIREVVVALENNPRRRDARSPSRSMTSMTPLVPGRVLQRS